MDHANASSLLSEYAAGRLAAADAEGVRAHVRDCAECRGVLAAMNDVRAEIRDHGDALFTDHPRAEDLARWAQTPHAMEEAVRVPLERHVRACPTCSREAAWARDAALSAWRRSLAGRFARKDEAPWSAWLRLMPLAAAVLLAFPAYLGLVELPRERARATRPAPAPAPSPPPIPSTWSGGVKTLVLSGPTRGEDAIPSIRPEPGQPYVPIVLAVEGLPATGALHIVIERADGTVAWEHRSSASSIWDPANRVASFLVPTDSLAPGAYRIDVRRTPRANPLFSARFRVIEPPSSAP